MDIIKRSIRTAMALLALPLLLVNVTALGQEQVLAEVGVVGSNSNGDGVVKPDFNDSEAGDYTDWIAPAGGRDYRGFAISPKGTALVLDGNFIREFNVAGDEQFGNGYPVDCTAIEFGVPKRNGQIVMRFLSECGAFTPLNDDTIRIAGESKGGGFVIIKYERDGTTTLAANGTPPSITDMDGDEFDDAGLRKGAGYWAVGDRKKVIWFPLDSENPEQNFEVVATLNGKRIDSVTPFGAGRVVVVLDTGEMLSIDTSTGIIETPGPEPLLSAEDCGLGRKDPQRYSVRGDPTGVLFASNRGCNTITLFDENLVAIIADDVPSLVVNPFQLDDKTLANDMSMPDPFDPFFVEGLDWQIGQGGDFLEGCDDPLSLGGCQFGAIEGQAIMFEVQVATGPQFDTTYRMFQFVDLVDCRHSGDRPCPILNCPAAAFAAIGTETFEGNDECNIDVVVPADDVTGVAITGNDTITRNDGGNFITDGFVVGGKIELANSADVDNDDTWDIATVASGVITVDGTSLTDNAADITMTMAVDNSDTFITGNRDEQVLDLTPLLLAADPTGVFRAIAFGEDDPPVMAIPAYMRGEFEHPPRVSDDANVFNGYKFVSFFAVTDAIFLKTFFADYQIDLFREAGTSEDPCTIPEQPDTPIGDINEVANLIVYNSGDGFGTIDRGGAEGTRGASIGNSFCNGGVTRFRWSANTIGLELFDETPTAYVTQVRRMMAELVQTKNELICNEFPDPNGLPGAMLGPLLLGSDCDLIQNELDQMNQKLEVCIDSLFASQQGNSAENCNAFFTKGRNLKDRLDAAAWPTPGTVSNLDLLRPNYEGEILTRLDALVFFVESYLLNGVPVGGIPTTP